ncbi:hypothetical protein [Pseudoalteromonas piscicida]|uniref:DUF4062 domain-containing protein n=1 Tax=Pseudoalteromonas piscicida TaxID=43662 RepID=A0A2A5JW93_PSEO7|nr:hypothetical protein [Pseudoalteromonas piscicida]PCK33678.1 hypothetical protein CEX98_00695 [Pseudoalteromonas piscicida]
MSFNAKVIKVLIASPGDVANEREAIAEVISRWNSMNSETQQVVLLPVGWETHSAPLLGGRAQGFINEQVVNGCDMLVGVFWTRLGSPTGVSESGTVEEIEHFIDNGKPVMLYFSSQQVDINNLDLEQLQSLRAFQKKMQKIGLTGSYRNLPDFKEQLLGQLSINIQRLNNGEPINVPTEAEVKEKAKVLKKAIKEGRVYMEDYEKDGHVKSFLVKGDTKEIKDGIKNLGGKWNRALQGWIFPKSMEIEVADFIKNNT